MSDGGEMNMIMVTVHEQVPTRHRSTAVLLGINFINMRTLIPPARILAQVAEIPYAGAAGPFFQCAYLADTSGCGDHVGRQQTPVPLGITRRGGIGKRLRHLVSHFPWWGRPGKFGRGQVGGWHGCWGSAVWGPRPPP